MYVYTCTDHATHWPVGGASVIVANNEAEARHMLHLLLIAKGLDPTKPFTLQPLDITNSGAYMLRDGDY
jgi:hypothetical protein